VEWDEDSAEVTHSRSGGVIEYELVRDVIECGNILSDREDLLDDLPESEVMSVEKFESTEKSASQVAHSALIEAVLSLPPEKRRQLLPLPIVHATLLSKDSVGPWILDLLDDQDERVRDSIADYLVEASRLEDGELVSALSRELGKLPFFLPRLLKLSDKMQEHAVSASVVMQVHLLSLRAKEYFISFNFCILPFYYPM